MSNEKEPYNKETLYYSLTYEDVVRIFKLVDDYNYNNLNIELGDLKLQIDKSGLQSSPQETSGKSQIESSLTESSEDKIEEDLGIESIEQNHAEKSPEQEKSEEGVLVKTSISGVFYSSPSPDKEPFVTVGSKVEKGDEIGLIEVMKLFNSVNAPCDGVIKEIYVNNESVVNLGDVLMIIEPL